MPQYHYSAQIVNVVDGDTFDALVDLGFNVHVRERFRLSEIDTPETHRPRSEGEKVRGEAATRLVEELVLGKRVMIETRKTGKYGRWLAIVHLNDGRTLAQVLKEEGLEKIVT